MSLLKSFIHKNQCTQLCVGPMSKNCVDAAIDIANEQAIPMILIASRRQIDSMDCGGGYVENWTTDTFSEYVKSKNASNVFLARDHGGPWQGDNEVENNLNLEQSMASALRAFKNDIDAGFDFIHIDPSIPIQGEDLTIEKILSRLFELYGSCDDYARTTGKSIEFELGTEEQDGYGQDLEKMTYFLEETQAFCHKNKITKPTFIVAQTGTKVMEMRNVGNFNDDTDPALPIQQLKNTLALCKKHNLLLKEHNADYLNDNALALRPALGVPAVNVAPEFGVVETKTLLSLFKKHSCNSEYEQFCDIALQSNKWKKWMLPNTKATDLDRAMICGHYIFSDPRIKALKTALSTTLYQKGLSLEDLLKKAIKQNMLRYLSLFRCIEQEQKEGINDCH